MDGINFWEIITQNWSQITLVLLGIGYLMKTVIDNNSKRSQINFTLFQERKLDSLNKFFLNHSTQYHLWYNFPIHKAAMQGYSAIELDSMIFASLNELKGNVLEMKLYFNEEMNHQLSSVLQNYFSINSKLKKIILNNNEAKKSILILEFQVEIEKVFADNSAILENITKQVKKDFR